MLKEEYTFITLPNDYLINKRRLPANPLQLKLKEQFIFPMNNTKDIQHFFEVIPDYYQISDPLLSAYANTNYTDRPDLPNNYNLVTKVNLTVPIMTPKELIIAARALRKHYYFHTIPEEWIQIPTTNIDTSRQIPNTNEELNKVLQLKDPDTIIHFPITDQTNIANAIELLKQYFDFDNVPNFIFAVNDLPLP